VKKKFKKIGGCIKMLYHEGNIETKNSEKTIKQNKK
jgi:hypothetical protein